MKFNAAKKPWLWSREREKKRPRVWSRHSLPEFSPSHFFISFYLKWAGRNSSHCSLFFARGGGVWGRKISCLSPPPPPPFPWCTKGEIVKVEEEGICVLGSGSEGKKERPPPSLIPETRNSPKKSTFQRFSLFFYMFVGKCCTFVETKGGSPWGKNAAAFFFLVSCRVIE